MLKLIGIFGVSFLLCYAKISTADCVWWIVDTSSVLCRPTVEDCAVMQILQNYHSSSVTARAVKTAAWSQICLLNLLYYGTSNWIRPPGRAHDTCLGSVTVQTVWRLGIPELPLFRLLQDGCMFFAGFIFECVSLLCTSACCCIEILLQRAYELDR